jgi:hypothetical protein
VGKAKPSLRIPSGDLESLFQQAKAMGLTRPEVMKRFTTFLKFAINYGDLKTWNDANWRLNFAETRIAELKAKGASPSEVVAAEEYEQFFRDLIKRLEREDVKLEVENP